MTIKTSKFSRTFDKYDYVDCFNYMHLHDQLKYYKCGFSKVTDHACREIRHGRLKREDATKLVAYYTDAALENETLFSNWLGTTNNSVKFVMDMHRNPAYWEEKSPQKWEYKRSTSLDGSQHQKKISRRMYFVNNEYKEKSDSDYTIIGKGYP